jgi:hypothetical protein
MKKYCLTSEHNNSKWYFTGKIIRRYDEKFDYWEGSSLTPQMNTCTYDNYFDALLMKLECLFATGRLYTISLVSEEEKV